MIEWTKAEWHTIKKAVSGSDHDYSDDFLFWTMRNKSVVDGFIRKALQAKACGHKHRFGAKAILEVLRWETMTHENDKTFKINNNRAPDMARLAMDLYPKQLAGYFSIRGSAYKQDAVK